VELGQPPGAFPRGIKLPGREAASSAMVKNAWSCTAAPPVCLMTSVLYVSRYCVFYTFVLAACHHIGTDAVDAITLCLQTRS